MHYGIRLHGELQPDERAFKSYETGLPYRHAISQLRRMSTVVPVASRSALSIAWRQRARQSSQGELT